MTAEFGRRWASPESDCIPDKTATIQTSPRPFFCMHYLGISDFGLFCLAVFLLNLTPGPDTAYIVGRSVAQGRNAGLVSALGISLGACVHTLASALGLSAILTASATAFMVVKIAGGLYLVYLGLRMLVAKKTAVAGDDANDAINTSINNAPSLHTIFWQAAVTNVLNPKVALFFLSFFPQFVQRDAGHQTLAFLVLGLTFIVMSTIWNSGTAFVAGTLTLRVGAGNSSNSRLKKWLERAIGGAFVALGVKLAFSKH